MHKIDLGGPVRGLPLRRRTQSLPAEAGSDQALFCHDLPALLSFGAQKYSEGKEGVILLITLAALGSLLLSDRLCAWGAFLGVTSYLSHLPFRKDDVWGSLNTVSMSVFGLVRARVL